MNREQIVDWNRNLKPFRVNITQNDIDAMAGERITQENNIIVKVLRRYPKLDCTVACTGESYINGITWTHSPEVQHFIESFSKSEITPQAKPCTLEFVPTRTYTQKTTFQGREKGDIITYWAIVRIIKWDGKNVPTFDDPELHRHNRADGTIPPYFKNTDGTIPQYYINLYGKVPEVSLHPVIVS